MTGLLVAGWTLTIIGFLLVMQREREQAQREREQLLDRLQFPDRPVMRDVPKPPDLGPPEPEPVAGLIIRDGDKITDADREALKAFGIEA